MLVSSINFESSTLRKYLTTLKEDFILPSNNPEPIYENITFNYIVSNNISIYNEDFSSGIPFSKQRGLFNSQIINTFNEWGGRLLAQRRVSIFNDPSSRGFSNIALFNAVFESPINNIIFLETSVLGSIERACLKNNCLAYLPRRNFFDYTGVITSTRTLSNFAYLFSDTMFMSNFLKHNLPSTTFDTLFFINSDVTDILENFTNREGIDLPVKAETLIRNANILHRYELFFSISRYDARYGDVSKSSYAVESNRIENLLRNHFTNLETIPTLSEYTESMQFLSYLRGWFETRRGVFVYRPMTDYDLVFISTLSSLLGTDTMIAPVNGISYIFFGELRSIVQCF